MIIERSLDDYCRRAITNGATHALVTEPSRIITEPWVRWKCQFGCPNHGKSYCCPPHTPTSEQTRQTLDSYNRAILFHLEWTKGKQSGKEITKYMDNVVSMEIELFLYGFYRAYSLLAGYCILCRHMECGLIQNQPCRHPERARPSMEGCGIDVFKTIYNHGLPLYPLRTEEETRNIYCAILVD